MIVFRLFLQFTYTVNFNMGSLPAELPAKNIYVYAKAIQRAGKKMGFYSGDSQQE